MSLKKITYEVNDRLRSVSITALIPLILEKYEDQFPQIDQVKINIEGLPVENISLDRIKNNQPKLSDDQKVLHAKCLISIYGKETNKNIQNSLNESLHNLLEKLSAEYG